MIAYIVIAVIAMLVLFSSNTLNRLEFSDSIYETRNHQLSAQIESLEQRIFKLEQSVEEDQSPVQNDGIGLTPTQHTTVNLPDSATESRVRELEAGIKVLRQEFDSLRSVLNPTEPSALLSVLRLGDKFEFLTKELDSIRTEIDETKEDFRSSIQQNYESTIRHVDAVTSTIGWLAVLLVPLILTAVRDFLPRRNRDAESVEGIQRSVS